jgi:hypothetical protein
MSILSNPSEIITHFIHRAVAIVSTTVMRRQYWAQHEHLPYFIASQKTRIMILSYLCHCGIFFHHIT